MTNGVAAININVKKKNKYDCQVKDLGHIEPVTQIHVNHYIFV